MPDVGGRQDEIAGEEQRLGLTLPASVREYVAYAFDVFPRPDDRRVHMSGYMMRTADGGGALSILIDGETDTEWMIRHADLTGVDPAVEAYRWDATTQQFRPNGFASVRVSGLLLKLADLHAPAAGRFSAWEPDGDLLRHRLEATFAHWWADPGESQRTQYEHEAGLMAWVCPSYPPGAALLYVDARVGLARDAVPDFLWEYANQDETRGPRGRTREGLFGPPGDDIPL